MKIPLTIQPARREIEDGYEIDFADRDIIPIRFTHALAAAVLLPFAGATAYILGRILFSIP
jgi:hypothetical protein